MAESPITSRFLNADRSPMRSAISPGLQGHIPVLDRDQPLPKHSPPPATPGNVMDESDDDDNSPEAQILLELQAYLSRCHSSKQPDQDSELPRSPITTDLKPVHEDDGVKAENINMDDQANRMLPTQSQQALNSPTPSTSSLKEMTFDDDDDDDDNLPLEAIRRRKAATFDTSELDFFLTKQAEPESNVQSTPQELARTQRWGRIDPRVTWPPERNEDWLEEKRKEIEARGGRKANFGKHLTAQVRKERAEKGWDIHQNCEALPDHITAKTSKHMEELFGMNLDDLVPGVRNGRLVMVEKEKPAEGGGKKQTAALKYYPVF